MRPKFFTFGAWPDWRINLRHAQKARDIILLAQDQIVDAGLDRGTVAHLAPGTGKLIAAPHRTMHDMGMASGHCADFVDLGHRKRFRQFGPRQTMRPIICRAFCANTLCRGKNHLMVFVMHASSKPEGSDGFKTRGKRLRRQAREPNRMRPESRKLEGGYPGLNHFCHAKRTLIGMAGAVKRKVDPRPRLTIRDLGADAVSRGDQITIIIGHVDDGRDPTRSRRTTGTSKAFMPRLTAAVDVRVDHTGQDKGRPMVVMFLRGRRLAGTNRHHLPIADRNETARNHPISQDQIAGDHQIAGHSHPLQCQNCKELRLPGQCMTHKQT